jgi:hypothetical protein
MVGSVLLLAACGGGNDNAPARPTPSVTATPRPPSTPLAFVVPSDSFIAESFGVVLRGYLGSSGDRVIGFGRIEGTFFSGFVRAAWEAERLPQGK